MSIAAAVAAAIDMGCGRSAAVSVAPSSPASRPSPSGGLRPASTSAAGGSGGSYGTTGRTEQPGWPSRDRVRVDRGRELAWNWRRASDSSNPWGSDSGCRLGLGVGGRPPALPTIPSREVASAACIASGDRRRNRWSLLDHQVLDPDVSRRVVRPARPPVTSSPCGWADPSAGVGAGPRRSGARWRIRSELAGERPADACLERQSAGRPRPPCGQAPLQLLESKRATDVPDGLRPGACPARCAAAAAVGVSKRRRQVGPRGSDGPRADGVVHATSAAWARSRRRWVRKRTRASSAR
jgi:hypothetical protein